LPPSETIWNQRIATSPSVQWERPPAIETTGSKEVGILNNDTLIILEGSTLIGLNLADGREQWRHDETTGISNATLDSQQPILYLSRRTGQLGAFSLLDAQGQTASAATASPPTFTALWEIELDFGLGTPILIPFPQGGVVVVARQWLSFITANGNANWIQRATIEPFAWTTNNNRLLLSTIGAIALWQIDESGIEAWDVIAEGYPLVTADQQWLYSRDGLYLLDETSQTVVLQYPLPSGSLTQGDATSLPDGGMILAHSDRFDDRLLAFNPDGSLRWERSYRDLISGRVHLLAVGSAPYLITQSARDDNGTLAVYTIDPLAGNLTHLFSGGSRTFVAADTWMEAAADQLLLKIGGGHLVSLDLQEARINGLP
jgi:outer membrane protein assembly factor BamB